MNPMLTARRSSKAGIHASSQGNFFSELIMMNRPTSIGAAVVALVAPGAAAAVGGLGDRLDLLQDGVQLTIGPSCNKQRRRRGG